jgi:heme oxygenase
MSDEPISTPPQSSLPLEIKAATRTQHNALNRLISPRIRLCLPPHTQTPQLYACGLSVFGNVYTTFEEEWLRFLERGKTTTSRMVDILQIVHIPELLRSRKLEHEMAKLKLYKNSNTTSQRSRDTFQAHQSAIRTSIRTKPHTLLAYVWVMYMALFNGGRMIRDQLITAPPAFWHCSQTPSDFEEGVDVILTERLQFWDFGRDDGAAIKEDFKTRFEIAAVKLTASERVDVVDEAARIFEMCRQMVDWLDANASAGLDANQGSKARLIRQRRRWYEWVALAIPSLSFSMLDLVWGMFVSICCYLFYGRTQSKMEVRKTVGTESDTDTPRRS